MQKIMDLCERLLDEISKSREVERRSFDLWMQQYEKTKMGVEKRLDETNASID